MSTYSDRRIVTEAPNHAPAGNVGRDRAERSGRTILVVAAGAFVAIAIPLVWRGAPLADDFNNCVAPTELGLGGFMAASWQQLGAIRPARMLEILVTASVCGFLPFGVAILVPLLLTLSVALLVRGLLRDLGTPKSWADVGGALWLLQPLGTEAGLWPAALHVPLGLALALAAVRLYGRGRNGWAAVANLGAAMSVEQAILPLILAAWLVAPLGKRRTSGRREWRGGCRRRCQLSALAGCQPAASRRSARADRGTHEPTPFSMSVFPLWVSGCTPSRSRSGGRSPGACPYWRPAAVVGWRIGPYLTMASRPLGRRELVTGFVAFIAIIVLANVVVVLAVPQQGSPRVFAPTWLVLAVAAGAGGASVRWRRPRLLGTIGGLFAAGAVLSLMLSVSVRLRSADFTARAAAVVAARVPDGGRVAVCHVRRTVVQPAPRGAFAVHEFIYEWAAERALQVLHWTPRHDLFVRRVVGSALPTGSRRRRCDRLRRVAGRSPPVTAVPRAIAPDVTVIVPTMGGPFLRGCLESIVSGTVWPARLVVIDQGGGIAAAEWVAAVQKQGMGVLHVPAAHVWHLGGDQQGVGACAHALRGRHA